MGKTRNRNTRFLKKAIPIVNNGLYAVGKTAKRVAISTAPIIERGVSTVYGTLATGFDLGVKKTTAITKKYLTKKRKLRHYKSSKRLHK